MAPRRRESVLKRRGEWSEKLDFIADRAQNLSRALYCLFYCQRWDHAPIVKMWQITKLSKRDATIPYHAAIFRAFGFAIRLSSHPSSSVCFLCRGGHILPLKQDTVVSILQIKRCFFFEMGEIAIWFPDIFFDGKLHWNSRNQGFIRQSKLK